MIVRGLALCFVLLTVLLQGCRKEKEPVSERERPAGFVVMLNPWVPNLINQIGEDLRNAIRKHGYGF